MNTFRRASALAALSMSLMVVAACTPQVVTPEPSTLTLEPGANRAIAPSPPEDPRPAVVWPLTGEDATQVAAGDMEHAALSIKIENSSNARPQTQLDKADVVYEAYAEYGISRFMAVYHSDIPESVGPIRSMRPMDPDLAGPYRGPLIFSGAQARFIQDARNAGADMLIHDGGASGFFRVNTKPSPHNLHGTLQTFLNQSTEFSAPPAHWQFAYPAQSATAIQEGQDVGLIDLYMSAQMQPEWEWDAGAERFMRLERGTPHVTADGTQLAADNVIILQVHVEYTKGTSRGRVPVSLMEGEGNPGFVASGGKYIEIEWSKDGRTDPIVITTLDGTPVTLVPGQTWVELVPRSGVSDTAVIEFE